MWSDRYNYYNIQSDPFFDRKVETKIVIDILLNTKLSKQKNHQTFSNVSDFPWVEIILVETKDGSFASSDKELPFVTLVAIVCSKGENIDQAIYVTVFSNIAKILGWELYLEADDDSNEDIRIT